MTDCVEWHKARNAHGYGMVWYKKKVWLKHRATWDEHRGPIPTGLKVLHKCDNPSCYNIEHLFLGTQADNNRDMRDKGRLVSPKGEEDVNSKLTEEDIRQIRSSTDSGLSLSRRFKVSHTTIYKILKREDWKHVR